MTRKERSGIFNKMQTIEKRIKGCRFKSAEEYDELLAKLRVLQAEWRA